MTLRTIGQLNRFSVCWPRPEKVTFGNLQESLDSLRLKLGSCLQRRTIIIVDDVLHKHILGHLTSLRGVTVVSSAINAGFGDESMQIGTVEFLPQDNAACGGQVLAQAAHAVPDTCQVQYLLHNLWTR